MSGNDEKSETLDWLRLKSDIGSVEIVRETGWEKLTRKCKENPLVPFGAVLTVGCLLMGLDSFRRGETRKSQLMMRGRVLAQGFTVASLVIGLMYTASKKNSQAQHTSTPVTNKGPI